MALRVIPELSPRLIIVPIPDVEITIQDLVDDLRAWEEQPQNMAYPRIILASGKDDLGGGVSVGLTATLQNALLQFEARTTPDEEGTATTLSSDGLTLIDSAATFQTNSITPGASVINLTTGASGTVLTVDSEIQLSLQQLAGGTRSDWQVTDVYDVHNVIQCNISGGNLVAIDGVGANIDPVFPSTFTQVVRTSSASATLQELADIQFASFSGGVWYDAVNGVSGTTYPTGTERQPVDNFVDGLSIASTRGFNQFYVIGDATVDSGLNYTDYAFRGQGQNLTVLTVTSAANVTNGTFTDAEVTGTLDGDSQIEDCIITSLDFISGVVENCILSSGTITLGGSETAHFIDCESGVPGLGTPVIDIGGSGQDLAMRAFSGGIKLTNMTGTQDVSIDLISGQVRLDLANLTAGTIVVRGVGKVVDDATGDFLSSDTYSGMTLVNETVEGTMVQEMWKIFGLDKNNPMTVTPTARTAGDVSQTITGDQITTSTVTRDP